MHGLQTTYKAEFLLTMYFLKVVILTLNATIQRKEKSVVGYQMVKLLKISLPLVITLKFVTKRIPPNFKVHISLEVTRTGKPQMTQLEQFKETDPKELLPPQSLE